MGRIRQAWMCWDPYDPERDETDHCVLLAGHDGWHSDGVGGYWEEGQ